MLTSGVISSLGSGLRFSGTNFFNAGSYEAYRFMGTVVLSGNGTAFAELGMQINQASGTSYQYIQVTSGTSIEAITAANAFLLARMTGGTDYFMDVTVQAGSSSAPAATNPIVSITNQGSWQSTAQEFRAFGWKGNLGSGPTVHTVDIGDDDDTIFADVVFSGTTVIYMYGIRRNR